MEERKRKRERGVTCIHQHYMSVTHKRLSSAAVFSLSRSELCSNELSVEAQEMDLMGVCTISPRPTLLAVSGGSKGGEEGGRRREAGGERREREGGRGRKEGEGGRQEEEGGRGREDRGGRVTDSRPRDPPKKLEEG